MYGNGNGLIQHWHWASTSSSASLISHLHLYLRAPNDLVLVHIYQTCQLTVRATFTCERITLESGRSMPKQLSVTDFIILFRWCAWTPSKQASKDFQQKGKRTSTGATDRDMNDLASDLAAVRRNYRPSSVPPLELDRLIFVRSRLQLLRTAAGVDHFDLRGRGPRRRMSTASAGARRRQLQGRDARRPRRRPPCQTRCALQW